MKPELKSAILTGVACAISFAVGLSFSTIHETTEKPIHVKTGRIEYVWTDPMIAENEAGDTLTIFEPRKYSDEDWIWHWEGDKLHLVEK